MTDDVAAGKRLQRLFATHADVVRSYAVSRVGEDAASDVVSETFLVAWRRIDAVPTDALPWLLGVARKVIASYLRSRGRHSALIERLGQRIPAGAGSAGDVEGRLLLAEALSALPPQDLEVLVTSAWYDLTAKQAARVLGCSSAAYAVRLHRARRRLRRELERRDPSLSGPQLAGEASQ